MQQLWIGSRYPALAPQLPIRLAMNHPSPNHQVTTGRHVLPTWGSGRPVTAIGHAATPLQAAEPATLVELLRLRAEHHGNDSAFSYAVDGEQELEELTYGQLDTRARAVAARLQQSGLTGSRAILLYPSGLEFLEAFFGCLYAGVIAVPAYPPRRNRNAGRIEQVVRDAEASVVLSTTHALERTDRVVDADTALRNLPWWATDTLPSSDANAWRAGRVESSDIAFLQYTSGSTGDPKGVMLSHRNLMQNVAVIQAGFETTSNDRAVFWLPLYHDMGLIGGILEPLYARIPCTLMSPAHFLQQPLRWLKMIENTRATISGGPNFAYDLCVDRITDEQASELDLRCWDLAFNGAEPVRAETLSRFADKFARSGFRRDAFYPCYGLAESTLLVAGGQRSSNPLTRTVDSKRLQEGDVVSPDTTGEITTTQQLVLCGRALLDQDARVVNPATHEECKLGEVGEIWVAGGSVADGYWRRPQLSRDVFAAEIAGEEKRFLRTGDLGFFDEAGLYVSGRMKDVIVIRGANHYPQDIEQTAASIDELTESLRVAAFGADGEKDEELVIVQEIHRAQRPRAYEIEHAIKKRVVEVHDIVPAQVVLVASNSLPKTSSGKLQRYACRQAYLDGKLRVITNELSATEGQAAPSAARNRDGTEDSSCESETLQAVFAVIENVAKERASNLQAETNLADMALDSLERMEIVAALEDQFGARFHEESIAAMQTPLDVAKTIDAEQNQSAQRTSREVQPADYDFAKSPEYLTLQENLRLTSQVGVENPYFTEHQGLTNDRTRIAGRELINFCSYNYLGMSGDPVVTAAAQHATARYGTSVSASRLVSGEKPLHRQLEESIASFLGAESAIAMVGGHATNETTIGHLFGPDDLILHDVLAHNSIVQGIKLSGARRRAFAHNDVMACRDLLSRYRKEYRRVLIVVEGVYSMDGDVAPLPELVELKEEFKAYLMVDEAHSLGTIGPGGRGAAAHFGVDPKRVDLWMGTMSKSLGSCGGYIAARREIVEYLRYTAPGFVYSVGLSPANTAAALASLKQLEAEPARVEQLQKNAELFLTLACEAGLNTGASRGTPIVPVITGNSAMALRLADRLFRDGVNVQPILYPAVEESAARLRFFITSDHKTQQIRRTLALLAKHWNSLTRDVKAA